LPSRFSVRPENSRDVTVLLPPKESRLLTRELFYTAVTRAKEKIRVVGQESSVHAAVRRRAIRASGLGRRLQTGD
jgi:exodeoxyribonuclease V alpha subunit